MSVGVYFRNKVIWTANYFILAGDHLAGFVVVNDHPDVKGKIDYAMCFSLITVKKMSSALFKNWRMSIVDNKPVLLITATIIIMFSVLLIAANHLKDLDKEDNLLENEVAEVKDFQREISALESRLTHLEEQMPGVDTAQSLKAANMELIYIKDLLNKVTEIETFFGRVTGYEIRESILLEVELLESDDIIKVPLAEECTQYMVTEFTFGPVTTEEFLEYLDGSEDKTSEVFTVKMIGGKAVQIFPLEKAELMIQN